MSGLPGGGCTLLGRGQILGAFESVRELSTAFESEGQAGFALPGAAPAFEGSAVDTVARAVAMLVRAVRRRIDMDIWLWGYGDGPDDLCTLAEARAALPGLDTAIGDAEEEEVIALLAILTENPPPADPLHRVLGRRVRLLLQAAPPLRHPLPLALRSGADDTERRVRAFRTHGGPDLPFWAADRTLGIRFRFTHTQVSFRAHHPIFQEALLARCHESAIDLL